MNVFPKPDESNPGTDMLLEHIDGLYRYALTLSRDRTNAEDLVQETYVRALSALDKLRNGNNIKSWLFIILRNIWLNQLRRPRVVLQMGGADLDEYPTDTHATTVADPHSLLISKIDQECVRQAIQQLPRDAQEIIVLREFEELSYQEIASVLGCPMGTVMSRLRRARSKLRILLSGHLGSSAALVDNKSQIKQRRRYEPSHHRYDLKVKKAAV